MKAPLIFCSVGGSSNTTINVQKAFKIVLSKVFSSYVSIFTFLNCACCIVSILATGFRLELHCSEDNNGGRSYPGILTTKGVALFLRVVYWPYMPLYLTVEICCLRLYICRIKSLRSQFDDEYMVKET